MLGQIPKLIRLLLKKAILMLLGPHFVLNKSPLGKESWLNYIQILWNKAENNRTVSLLMTK